MNTVSIKSSPSEGGERFDLGEDDWSESIEISDSDFLNEFEKERNEMTIQTIMGQKVSLTLNKEGVEDDVKKISLTLNEENVEDDANESAVSIIENCIDEENVEDDVNESAVSIIENCIKAGISEGA